MADEKSERASRSPAVSPLRKGIFLGALALIIAAYAAYGLSHNRLSLTYWSSSGRAIDKIHFTGASAWLLAVAIWIVAAGLVIAIFEEPKTEKDRRGSLPSALANVVYLFLGTEAYKKQRLSVLVCFVGFGIGGVTYLLRMVGAI